MWSGCGAILCFQKSNVFVNCGSADVADPCQFRNIQLPTFESGIVSEEDCGNVITPCFFPSLQAVTVLNRFFTPVAYHTEKLLFIVHANCSSVLIPKLYVFVGRGHDPALRKASFRLNGLLQWRSMIQRTFFKCCRLPGAIRTVSFALSLCIFNNAVI